MIERMLILGFEDNCKIYIYVCVCVYIHILITVEILSGKNAEKLRRWNQFQSRF